MLTRRQYLATTATPAFLGFGPFGSGDDESELEYDGRVPKIPEHITARDDENELENYQPKLVTTPTARSDMRGMYGWIAESDEYDVTAYYYWTRYNTQRSVLYYLGVDWGPDEHYLDHEPTIVFVKDDGRIDSVVTTGGHHYAIEIRGDRPSVTEDRVDELETHVNLVVVRPHNHYTEAATDEFGGFVQSYANFGSWLNQRETWFRNGRFENTADVAVVDPFEFYDDGGDVRDHWWEPDTWDAWFARHVSLRRLSDTDEFRFE